MTGTIRCRVCGKVATEDVEMRGHVMRNHPEEVPEVVAKLAANPDIVEQNFRRKNKTGMFDKLLRAVDTIRGVVAPPPVFPEGDVLLSTGLRLAHKGRPSQLMRRWESEDGRVSVATSWEDLDHVSVGMLDKQPPAPELLNAIRCAFLGYKREVQSLQSPSGVAHLIAQPTGPRPPPYPVAPEGPPPVRRPVTAAPRTGRNERCSCGSGKKYKKCCGAVH